MSAVRNSFFQENKGRVLEVFLKNGVTLRGIVELWDTENFIIVIKDTKTGKPMKSLVPFDAYYSVKNKEGAFNGKKS